MQKTQTKTGSHWCLLPSELPSRWKMWEGRFNCCPLFRERQTLIHTLNNCEIALGQRRYNERWWSPAKYSQCCEKKGIPHHQLHCWPWRPPTASLFTLQPLTYAQTWCVGWLREAVIVCRAVCFETSFEEARERKCVRVCACVYVCVCVCAVCVCACVCVWQVQGPNEISSSVQGSWSAKYVSNIDSL